MHSRRFAALTVFGLVLLPATAVGQPSTSRADFGRDVQPILRERCYACHGPEQQMNGFRRHVKSRAVPIQAYFESGFPHGVDQWISAAGTAWAVRALAQVN